MRRGGLFFIGLISAVITIISLNMAFGRPGYYHNRFERYERFHRCEGHYYDHRYNDDKNLQNKNKQGRDSGYSY
ncbi:hypothetical protein [Parafilimonas sp.]|uniref:hypothetical protein n=1 Tax=Parafilimonas sp. TaxID=1969739 RepID=UPI0039E6E8D0